MLQNLSSAAVVIDALWVKSSIPRNSVIRASLQETLILMLANNKGVALPADLGGLISAFVIYILERTLAKLLRVKV